MSTSSFVPALIGGGLLGAAATVLLRANGRVAGISGIVGGLLKPRTGDAAWRLTFVIGMLFGGVLLAAFHPSALTIENEPPMWLAIVAGLLVGVGTQVGNGCTSGHGICGVSRLSPRSIVATATFIATGALATFVVRHVAPAIGGAQ